MTLLLRGIRVSRQLTSSQIQSAVEFLDSWLPYRLEHSHAPGLIVGISIEGDLVYLRAFNNQNYFPQSRLLVSDRFDIGSQTKTFTATLIMQLFETNKLDLDDPVVGFLPWLSKAKDDGLREVTVKDLLTHQSGLMRDGPNADFMEVQDSGYSTSELREMILNEHVLCGKIGAWKYSNLGFALLGLLIENLFGAEWFSVVKRQILDPLALESISTSPSNSSRHGRVRGQVLELSEVTVMAPAFGLSSNMTDLCTYYDAQFLRSGKLLSDESKQEMQNNRLGFQTFDKKRLFGHSGSWRGHSSNTLCDPATKVTVSCFVNGIRNDATEAVIGIYAFLKHFGRRTKSADQNPLKSKYLGRYCGIYYDREVVIDNKRVIVIDPELWNPLSSSEKLEHLEGNRFVIRPYSYLANELVEFTDDSDGVAAMRYAGRLLKRSP